MYSVLLLEILIYDFSCEPFLKMASRHLRMWEHRLLKLGN
jgi:hypothetical protein